MSRDPPQRREARARNGVAPYIPVSFAGMPGAQATARQRRRDRNGRCKPGFRVRVEARQGGDSSAGSVHDSPPRQGTPGKAINRRGTEIRRGRRRTVTGTVTTEK
ncbi:hypothetical protein [Escherichia coli]|uniref:hypothetical protein n=1 Tax=Escherichia coli TaxID=562 RepID=UPI003CC91D7F